jgi:alpha-L-rhamnosidase
MDFPLNFIAATTAFSSLSEFIPAPYIRKSFTVSNTLETADILICGLGFYELFVNGIRITKGALAPYISAPDDLMYYDLYNVQDLLKMGENVIGILLGNGMQNASGGYVWSFDKARWRGAPMLALRLTMQYSNSSEIIMNDTSFKTIPSPIFYDDLHNGEYYDARCEIQDWNMPGFDDSSWNSCIAAPTPRGEAKLCSVEPIALIKEIAPISVQQHNEGYLYDFGVNAAGLCKLKICGTAGQEIQLYYGEHIKDGAFYRRNICFDENDFVQKDIYILKDGEQCYTPMFTYHGFRYVLIKGMTNEQATTDALTYLIMNSNLLERGDFTCSNEDVNKLQRMTRVSDLSNFYYFPTDCPHREKNGWTADAALSAEHILLNLGAETSYREWLHNIRKAQNDAGALPGIVPTSGWGFEWGNGPAWDCVLIYLPYFVYIYRGDKQILCENAHAIFRYIDYITTKIRPDGLVAFGLGDWCPVGRASDKYKAPLEFTDTVIAMDICEKAAFIYGELNMSFQQEFALGVFNKLRNAARTRLLDLNTMTALGNCQTSQSMAIFYSLFDAAEKPAAFGRLLEMVADCDNHMDVGVLGGRVLFHVLADFGYSDLALDLIIKPSFPSYGYWLANGATSLWEDFNDISKTVNSLNHHFWGDISHWFIRHLAGICYKPNRMAGQLDICPKFARTIDYANGYHIAPEGKIEVSWRREDSNIHLKVTVPDGLSGYIKLENGFVFDDDTAIRSAVSGEYLICEPISSKPND